MWLWIWRGLLVRLWQPNQNNMPLLSARKVQGPARPDTGERLTTRTKTMNKIPNQYLFDCSSEQVNAFFEGLLNCLPSNSRGIMPGKSPVIPEKLDNCNFHVNAEVTKCLSTGSKVTTFPLVQTPLKKILARGATTALN